MKKFNFYILSGVLSSALLVGGFALTQSENLGFSKGENIQVIAANDDKQDSKTPKKKLTKAERDYALQKFMAAVNVVENNYVSDLDTAEVIDKAISGMLSNLDAHSAYLQQKDYEDLKTKTSGSFSGIGIQIGIKDGALTVIAPLDDTPAKKAGIKSGDIILKIDDKPTLDMKIDNAVSLMKGKKGTKVVLTIIRSGEPKPLKFEIKRDEIKVKSTFVSKIEDTNYAYLRVATFDQNVTQEARKGLKQLGKIDGIVLDLRGNPGGLLDQAVSLVSLFVKSGVVVSEKGKTENMELKVSGGADFPDVPLVVLVNGGSASASEIVAGALQDYKRAIILGESTFGKGSVQKVLPFGNKGQEALKLTVAKYYLPTGRSIQAVGIKPDIIVAEGEVPLGNENQLEFKEADLKRHLKNELANADSADSKGADSKDSKNTESSDNKNITQSMIVKDIQLKSAIDVLKTWGVIGVKTAK
ncbi:PDZ domain-containing protein [Helicobacter saguini]|uniref:PDZ domain-containing protein n=1 Tax=Helicobacter saguini TaxID=1548018 RepID=A0A347VNH7_9HELI|nr:S41 family peptidase [Helicobacter saguini]MWV61764.1 PDZ domain-containing protein [Helicobacter saguini]MWV67563.1 PDZ domain-containing protein [Helicobacter saguini]MWV69914.1 PDZ domain-containing protein [Helicobacter saguini]MWV72871.1 PDZ domain-containing protein [Helicobacter saguini]TLD93227.1 S41 family peptidase [Helicobacter saguini]